MRWISDEDLEECKREKQAELDKMERALYDFRGECKNLKDLYLNESGYLSRTDNSIDDDGEGKILLLIWWKKNL